ncbi:MAG TPA: CDP-6-deoxy-delta-3,4-glucoseen reductase [Gammaproteobacteria bacterium]
MNYKVRALPSGHEFEVAGDETILDAALRSGLAFPYGCRSGACGACKGKIIEGAITYGDEEPMALSEEEAAQGIALLCLAKPTSDIKLRIKEVGALEEIPVRNLPTKVAKMERLNDDVMKLSLKLPESDRLQFLAGQYVEFLLKHGKRRAFSIANAPHDDAFLTFHIRLIRGGEFTAHVFDDMQEGELLRIEGPHGSFFMREDSDRPMLMLATGTGFGPIKGIIEHAIAEKSKRPLYLYWGARHKDDLYLDALVRSWTEQYPHIHYIPVLSQPRPEDEWHGRTGHVQDAALADFTDLRDFELYACGHPQMVHAAKEALMTRGIDPEHCFSDAFEWAKDAK